MTAASSFLVLCKNRRCCRFPRTASLWKYTARIIKVVFGDHLDVVCVCVCVCVFGRNLAESFFPARFVQSGVFFVPVRDVFFHLFVDSANLGLSSRQIVSGLVCVFFSCLWVDHFVLCILVGAWSSGF